jgi:hypothetical protein
MGLTFRKSVRIGGLRLNFSGSGVGVSAGVRGARIGVNAKGRGYVDAGRGGFRYRAMLGGKRQRAAIEAAEAPRSGWRHLPWIVLGIILLSAFYR